MMSSANPVPSMEPTTSQKRVLPRSLLRDDETVLLVMRPHPLFILLVSLPVCAWLAAILVFNTLVAMLVGPAYWMKIVGFQHEWTWIFLCLVMLARIGWACLQWYNQLYLLTDRRVLTRGGVIRVCVYETSLRHVRQTLVHVNLRERVFGLGTILVATAATAIYDTAWRMLPRPVEVQRTIQNALARWGDGA